MAENEGEILRNKLKGTGKTMPEIARVLGMTRQNLNYHLRKDILEDDFKRLLNEKGKHIFHVEHSQNEDKLSDTASRFLKMLESQQRTIENLSEKVPRLADITDKRKNGSTPSETKMKPVK